MDSKTEYDQLNLAHETKKNASAHKTAVHTVPVQSFCIKWHRKQNAAVLTSISDRSWQALNNLHTVKFSVLRKVKHVDIVLLCVQQESLANAKVSA